MLNPLRNQQRSMQLMASILLCLLGGSAWAGFVTTNEKDLDAIFSQSAFRTPIDVRFNPTVTMSRPDLLTINTEQQLNTLFDLGDNIPTIDIFFVDAINECGGDLSPLIIGCGDLSGNKIVVKSSFAAGVFGAALMGHELGHNLGLGHVDFPPANLMNPTLNGSIALTTSQPNTILGSPDVQIGPGGAHFILITPFAIVPEPATMLFALAGAVWLLQRARRRPPA